VGPGGEDQGEARTPRSEERARAYARLRRRLFLVDLLLAGGGLSLFLVSGLAVRWREALQTMLGQPPGPPPAPLQALPLLLLYVVSLTLAATLLTLPLSYYGGFLLPHRFGLSTQTRPAWALDMAKATLLGVAQTALVAIPIYALLWLTPDWWWLWAGLVLTLFGVVLTNLAPVLIVPLFYTLRPLPAGDLRVRLERLAAECGTVVRGVFVMDMSRRTRAANAALMGIGNTRRIVLGDTLLAAFDGPEVGAVLAHELGHHVHRDLWRAILLDGALTLGALWLADRLLRVLAPPLGIAGLTDVAALPLIALLGGVLFVAAMPLTNGLSRRREAAADAFAVRVTGDPDAWKGALRRLAEMNLAEVDPPPWVEWLLYSHPSIRHRLEAADRVGTRPRGP
jgi:STE24 endopeptidase